MRQDRSYLNCPRCGLSIGIRTPWLAMTYCPRCIARTRTAVELFGSEMPVNVPCANGSIPSADTIAGAAAITAGQAARAKREPVVAMTAATGTDLLPRQPEKTNVRARTRPPGYPENL
jgi:hypothetical protein